MVKERSAVFTVPQVAAALGIKAAEVRELLPSHRADGFTLERGGTPAWTLAGMPYTVKSRLHESAAQHGYSNAETLLSSPPDRWLTAEEIVRLDALCLNLAAAVRSLLSSTLQQWEEWTTLGEAVTRRIEAKIFQDHPERAGRLDARDLRTLIRRAIRRDNEAGQWQRVDLYLPGRAWSGADRAAARELVPTKNARFHHQISLYSEVCRALRHKPFFSRPEREAVWLASFLDQAAATMNAGCDISRACAALMATNFGGVRLALGGMSSRHFYRLWLAHYEHWKGTGKLLACHALRLAVKQTKRRAA